MDGIATGVGRPREFDERAVLDAAVDLFWEHGFAGTTTRMLEAELGVTQSSIYNAFGSKAGLMEAALDRYEERLGAAVVARIDPARDATANLDDFLAAVVEWVHQGERRGCMLLNALADGAPDDRIFARAVRYRDSIRAILTDTFASAGLADDDVEARTEALLAGVIGLNTLARGRADAAELRRLADGLRRRVVAV